MEKNNRLIANTHVVLLAVFLLGGDREPVDVEDIAVKAFELSPARFCWKKYPDRIDIRIVTYALKDAMRIFPPVFVGSLKHGYMITIDGVELLQQVKLINSQLRTGNRTDTTEALRQHEIERLVGTNAYKKYVAGELSAITKQDFFEFARINDYFPSHIRAQRFIQIKKAIVGNFELEEIWKYLLEKFHD